MQFSAETHKLAQKEAEKILMIREQNSSYVPNYSATMIDDFLNNSEMQKHNLAHMESLCDVQIPQKRKFVNYRFLYQPSTHSTNKYNTANNSP